MKMVKKTDTTAQHRNSYRDTKLLSRKQNIRALLGGPIDLAKTRGGLLDEVKNEDDDYDDASDGKLDEGTENLRRDRVEILPADPPGAELRSAVDQVVGVRNTDDQQ